MADFPYPDIPISRGLVPQEDLQFDLTATHSDPSISKTMPPYVMADPVH
jgi:hypothetical protein